MTTSNLHTNGHASPTSLQTISQPPGQPNKAYIISTQDGEIIYIPLSISATRLLITGKETSNAFALVGSAGSQSDPIGFHYHQQTHDVFLCLQGKINVWANDQSRTMEPGDFASVPPNVIHQYQILGPHSEFIGLICPGGWEAFFRVLGDPYNGPQWPANDSRPFHEALLPRLKAAAQEFDMIPCPQHAFFGPQPWLETDNALPGKPAPYFVKNATGPAWELGGMVARPLVTGKESEDKFSIGSIETSAQYNTSSIFSTTTAETPSRHLKFPKTHHAFLLVAGSVKFNLSENNAEKASSTSETTLTASEVIYIPANTAFHFTTTSRYAKMYAFASGEGLIAMLCQLGTTHGSTILPEKAGEWDRKVVAEERLEEKFGAMVL
ncbi:Hypothetical protein R9X50_00064800 [Acrodontium crateriforme]|uniref:Cupin type-2 domain-containing protein n=1 Tax=Acrodontium crateriforme TaxID=150365 RepID=A0AAQ3LXL5_9PEZI|nr:Hypothetical protein R9X50_00064800 [Acrodontium crateriforme]